MANTYKNIVITPNITTAANVVPTIQFSGGDTTTNTDINLRVYTTSSGTLSFEGSAGQLFSITNDLTNSIFSVNDVSGIPSVDVYANGAIYLAPFGGNVSIDGNTVFVDSVGNRVGIANSAPVATLQVSGSLFVSQNNASQLDTVGEIAEFAHNANSYAQIHVRNANTGTRASVDIVATSDVGTDATDFIDLGINNSNYNDPAFTINGARDGYLYTSNGNLAIGVANTNRSLTFFTGGTLSTNERMRVDPSGNVGIGITTPTSNLHVIGTANITSNTVIQGSLNVGFGNTSITLSNRFSYTQNTPSIVFRQNNDSLRISYNPNNKLAFTGSISNQELFSVIDNYNPFGTIYSITTLDGIPLVEVLNTGRVNINQWTGNVVVGANNTTNTFLQVGNNTTLFSQSISSGGLLLSISTVTSAYSLTSNDRTILANAALGGFSVTLPGANTNTGRFYTVKKIDSSANVISIATSFSQTIEGAARMNLNSQYATLSVQSDGSGWWIV